MRKLIAQKESSDPGSGGEPRCRGQEEWPGQITASSETLKCEGPVSTEQSSCHAEEEEDVTYSSDEDFQAKGYKFSKPFHLIISYGITWDHPREVNDTQLLLWATDWLILQGPDTSIFEGDPLVLQCRAWQDWPLTQVIFYQEDSALAPPGPKREFSIDVVQKSDSGNYHCSGVFRSLGPGSRETASPVAITVHELFPAPILKAFPSSEPQEGDSVTLNCQTKLSPQRSASRLLFSFYKDGRSLSIRSVSAELQIPKASEEHSGSYWCEAATEDRHVWKQSPQLEIQVQGNLNTYGSITPTMQTMARKRQPGLDCIVRPHLKQNKQTTSWKNRCSSETNCFRNSSRGAPRHSAPTTCSFS
ncbi:Fc receptor-like A isoform X4 [Mesocricetus auratus]|uniref:Fc receptor-like A isoform X4 n=1 Tax=Mesocricetus auratus TaxID=10036 RepID=A0ABM2WVS7_MESAU|nr:Fc receptor-like A isoform X4 [Mesocricetus auratus]